VGAYVWLGDASGPTRPVTVQIPEGSTASEVAEILSDADVIRSGLAFNISARLRGLSADLQAGRYALTTNMAVEDALDVLARGPLSAEVVELTFPEGLELREVAEITADSLGVSGRAFVKRAESGEYSLPPYLPEGTDTVEGFLFPKTYEVPVNASVEQVIATLLGQFETEVQDLPWDRAEQLGVSPYEVVIIASMIEREASLEGDRSKVAAVIYNRLDDGMRLQIDATVQYAIPGENRILTFDDYEYPSRYNTYLHDGLPPTPVAQPGLASLEAALNPANVDYLYYLLVEENTGRHAFFETEAEFCAAAPGC
jgi:peptidoglycan lytic transglycosylase G